MENLGYYNGKFGPIEDMVVPMNDRVFDGAELAVVVAEVFHGWMRFLSGPPGSGVKVD